MHPVLATTYLTTINNLLTGLQAEITALLIPAGVIGIVFGVVMWLMGSQHAPQTIRLSAIALAIGGVAQTVVPALIGGNGGG